MLPRSARLKRNRDFKAVYAQRRSYQCGGLILYVRMKPDRHGKKQIRTGDSVAPTASPSMNAPAQAAIRIGFVISKKVAKRAHDRNRLKRRLREICRLNLLPRVRHGIAVDMMFAARSSATELDYARLAADIDHLGRQAGLFAH